MAEEEITEYSLASSQAPAGTTNVADSVLYNYRVSIVLVLMGFYFLVFGIVELITNYSESSFPINMHCNDYSCFGESGSISFPNNSKVYIYLTNSKLTENEIGYKIKKTSSIANDIYDCTTYSTNQQMQKSKSTTGSALIGSDPAYPCGEFISYYPSENIKIINTNSRQEIGVESDNLSVFEQHFRNLQLSRQWTDVESGRFRIWNQKQTALGLNKYWGYITKPLSGNFSVTIASNNRLLPKFTNNLKVNLADNQSLGGYNVPLCICNFIMAVCKFVLGCVSFWVISNRNQREMKSLETTGQSESDPKIILPASLSYTNKFDYVMEN